MTDPPAEQPAESAEQPVDRSLPPSDFLRRLGYVIHTYTRVPRFDGGEELTITVRTFPGTFLAVRPRHDGVLLAAVEDDC